MGKKEVYLNPEISFQERAEDLVSRMTLEEKVSQMLHSSPAIERLGIPAYNWWNEGLHGVARAGTATMFPQAIGMAATFDEAILHKVADVISTEGRAKHHAYAGKTIGAYARALPIGLRISTFSVIRDGVGAGNLWEDPYLTSRLGVAFVKGLQGMIPNTSN